MTFCGQCNKELIVEVDGQELVHLGGGNSNKSGSMEMEKGRNYPINVKYLQQTGGEAYFKVLWSWAGQDQQIVPPEALHFTVDQAKWWNYVHPRDRTYGGIYRRVP